MKKIAFYFLSMASLTFIALIWIYPNERNNVLAKLLFQQNQQKLIEKEEEKPSSTEETEEDQDGGGLIAFNAEQIKKSGLKIETAAPGEMILSLSTRGKIALDPDRLAHIIPKIPGIALEASKNIGNPVEEGEILAVLESQEMADLKGAFLTSLCKEKLAASLLEKEKALYQKKISPEQDYIKALYAFEEAHINHQLARQKLATIGLDEKEIKKLSEEENPRLSIYAIYSPLTGTIMKRHITKGESIDSASPIYEIADLRSLWVETAIYPKDLPHIKEGQRVQILHPSGELTAEAQLFYLSPTISDESITAKAIALLDNPLGKWRPGEVVNVTITTHRTSCPLLISKDALQNIDGKSCVFVQTNKGFEKREVKAGRSDLQHIEILSGLLPGEQYVSSHSFLLKAELNKESGDTE